jgi:hypothetical protein
MSNNDNNDKKDISEEEIMEKHTRNIEFMIAREQEQDDAMIAIRNISNEELQLKYQNSSNPSNEKPQSIYDSNMAFIFKCQDTEEDIARHMSDESQEEIDEKYKNF